MNIFDGSHGNMDNVKCYNDNRTKGKFFARFDAHTRDHCQEIQ